MSPRDFTRYAATTLAAAACVFALSSVRAVELNDGQPGAAVAIAYSNPFSLPCHPSIDHGACLKHSQPTAEGKVGVAQPVSVAMEQEPFSADCHPSRKACANWARTSHAGFAK